MKITNEQLKKIIKEELDNILNEAEAGIIRDGFIHHAQQAGVYNVGLNIKTGEKFTIGYASTPSERTTHVKLRVTNLQLDNLSNVAYNIARVAKREGYDNIREDEILAALNSGSITLP